MPNDDEIENQCSNEIANKSLGAVKKISEVKKSSDNKKKSLKKQKEDNVVTKATKIVSKQNNCSDSKPDLSTENEIVTEKKKSLDNKKKILRKRKEGNKENETENSEKTLRKRKATLGSHPT